jgi:hypothetical protein
MLQKLCIRKVSFKMIFSTLYKFELDQYTVYYICKEKKYVFADFRK